MSKHTPGPWKAVISENNAGGWVPMRQYITIETESEIIAAYDTFSCEYPDDDENAANARVMAAAPDLLEALKRCVGSLRSVSPGGDGDHDVEFARAAIAKAEGQ